MTTHSPDIEPKVSIIVPVFNAANTLNQCLSSITAQYLRQFEVLIIDDGSTDNSIEICKRWCDGDPRFNLFSMRQHAGASAARNLGINAARGALITFVDADDWLEPEMLFEMVKLADKSASDLVCCSHLQNREQGENRKEDGAPLNDKVFSQQALLDYLIHYLNKPYLFTLFVHCWGKLYRRSFLIDNQLLFDEELSQLEDVNFNLRACQKASNIAYKQGHFYHHRIMSGSMSSQSGIETDAVEKMQRAFSPAKKLMTILGKDRQVDTDSLYSRLFMNTLIITIIRLSRRFLKQPERRYFHRIRLIANSPEVREAIQLYTPGSGESHLIYHALRLGSPPLVAMAGVIRASVIALKN